ncbi:hypothetical protein ACRE_038410 [Hapsidospora chrysogenum ATCC 11550]|uniref:Uncharacterized protein n=1 Tax=Hapsidospora chrysogenum (strain ATCC 11550 / CBS 779.69 / DSM 880 / IAM 14645 / JCM 23072 / IMI 49137) TaxID=857340 RepID=A0A086T7K8_HAPC1|nr:hypothetical protein ACRE_038410 [Hapsidospora chrysogenum ATCC 11550]
MQPLDKNTQDAAKGNTSGSLTGDTRPKALDERGAIGKQFTEQGAVGGTAQAIGGPFDKEGMVGKHFTSGGSVGGSVQSNLGGKKETGG